MKKLFFVVISASACITSAFTNTVLAGDAAALGASVFSANCIACHLRGHNVVVSDKSLKKTP